MSAYYNEFDPFAAQWLRELIKAGHIAPGEVDTRSIEDVTPSDLHGFIQCHFFAGIGIWSAALRGAGWPDDRPVWTGSCPCQPFSQAGQGLGVADERHLWPAWLHLIKHGKGAGIPILGEQVASADGLAWLDIVLADLEGEGYTARAVDLCSAGFGSPNIRQRLYFHATRNMGHANSQQHDRSGHRGQGGWNESANHGGDGWVAGTNGEPVRPEPGTGTGTKEEAEGAAQKRERSGPDAGPISSTGGVAGTGRDERRGRDAIRQADEVHDGAQGASEGDIWPHGKWPFNDAAVRRPVNGKHPGPTNGFWRDVDWILCRPEPRFPNGAWRPVEPGTLPLVAGAPNIVGRLCGYGNGLNKEVAQGFIKAVM